jgi:hypothetical protein
MTKENDTGTAVVPPQQLSKRNIFQNFRKAQKYRVSIKEAPLKLILRTTALEKLVYILVTIKEPSILHLVGGKVTLQVRRAVNQSKKPANGKIMFL